MAASPTPPKPSRRRFAGMLVGLIAAPAIIRVRETQASTLPPFRRLPVENTHTGETLDIVYYSDGLYHLEALAEIDHFMRDWRNDKSMRIDTKVLDLLAEIHKKLDTGVPFHVLSGYRSPETNEMLRKRGNRVAKNSLHMQGMAIDFYCPNRSIKTVRNTAKSFKAGGVGYYPRSGFVHIDTGPIRYW